MSDNIQEMQINLYKTYKSLCEFSTKYSTLESELTKLQQENKELKEKIKEITYIQVENADLKENLNFRLDKQNLFMDKYSAELEENAKLKEEIIDLVKKNNDATSCHNLVKDNQCRLTVAKSCKGIKVCFEENEQKLERVLKVALESINYIDKTDCPKAFEQIINIIMEK